MKSTREMLLLFVEDEENIRNAYVPLLKRRFKDVITAENGEEGLAHFKEHHPDIIFTDIAMPKMSGLEMIREIRKEDTDVNVIFLSAYTEKEYLLQAIEVRPIKYFVKPVNFDEFDNFFTNHFHHSLNKKVYLGHNLYFDHDNSQIISGETVTVLTQKERDFINLLIKYNGNLVSYETIETMIWKDKFMSSDSLRTLVKKIRKKSYQELIQNVSNTGYKVIVSE